MAVRKDRGTSGLTEPGGKPRRWCRGPFPWPAPDDLHYLSMAAHGSVMGAEDFVEFGEQDGFGEGFLDEVDAGFQDALLAEEALGVAGHEHHPHGGPEDADLAGEFPSLHVGHDDVGEQHID